MRFPAQVAGVVLIGCAGADLPKPPVPNDVLPECPVDRPGSTASVVPLASVRTLEVRGTAHVQLGDSVACLAHGVGPFPGTVAAGGAEVDNPGGSYGWVTLFAGDRRGTFTVDEGDMTVRGTDNKDELGYSVVFPGDVDGDGQQDLVATGWGSNRPEKQTGGAWLYPLTAGNFEIEDAKVHFVGREAGARMAGAAAAGDLDGDGLFDLVLGNTYAALYDTPGVIDVHLGHDFPATVPAESAASAITAEDPFHSTGAEMQVADVTGDGVPDLVEGAFNHTDLGTPGLVLVLSGPLTSPAVRDLSAASTVLVGDAPEGSNSSTGGNLATGDLDEDGFLDLVVSAHTGDGAAGSRAGKLYIFFGPLSEGVSSVRDADLIVEGAIEFEWLSAGLVTLDHNGDGHLDLAVSAPIDPYFGPSCVGRIYVFEGPLVRGQGLTPSQAAVVYEDDVLWTGLGWKLAACDLDGDGDDELVIGSRFVGFDSAPRAGRVDVVPGGPWPSR